jgi:hypothetical protein
MSFDHLEVGDRLLLRSEASDRLQQWFGQAGYICPAYLAKLASVGGGPPMVKFGRKVAYPERKLFDWAKARAKLVAHTSDSGDSL